MRNDLAAIACIAIALIISLSGCTTHHEGYVNGTVKINGSAEGPGFDRYVIEIGEGQSPSNWTILGVSLTEDGISSINESILGILNTSKFPDGKYTIRLTATDKNGLTSQDEVYVTVDNFPDGPTHECPVWTCGDLARGRNSVNISLPQESYGNNMNCSVRCSCPAGTNMGVTTAGVLEYFYDYVYLGEKNLTGFWNGTYSSLSADVDIVFTSDRSVDGNDVMYGYPLEGFKVTNIYCSDYCVPDVDCVLEEGDETSYISAVRLNSGESRSGFDHYSDSSETFTSLRPGMAYILYVEVFTDWWKPETVLAWVDYNHDYDLNDSGETVNLTYTGTNGTVNYYTKLLTVPQTATHGQTRMRVAVSVGELDPYYYICPTHFVYAPCGVYSHNSNNSRVGEEQYDEVEDYTIEISPSAVTTTRSSTTTSSTLGQCDLAGDDPPCGYVTLSEVVSLINDWSSGYASLPEVIALINAWAA